MFLVSIRTVAEPLRMVLVVRQVSRSIQAKEGFVMDPHFTEYLAAVAGMAELYGEPCPETGSDFHEEVPCVDCPDVVAAMP